MRNTLVALAVLALTGCVGDEVQKNLDDMRAAAERTCEPYKKFGELEHLKCVDRDYQWRASAYATRR